MIKLIGSKRKWKRIRQREWAKKHKFPKGIDIHISEGILIEKKGKK